MTLYLETMEINKRLSISNLLRLSVVVKALEENEGKEVCR